MITLKTKITSLSLIVTAMFLSASTYASVLYSYDFSGSGDMNGQTLNGQTWYGGGINAGGRYSLANNATGYESFGWQLQSGNVYNYQVTISQSSGTWAGIGIATSFGIWNMVAAPAVAASTITTGETWGAGTYQGGLASGSGTYRINVDTTGANWTTSFFYNDVQQGATGVWTGEAPFGPNGGTFGFAYFGLATYGNGSTTAGTFSNLELSAIPEPSALDLALVGTIGAILALRRSRKQGAGTAI
jgi:hypothetical protein